MPQSFDEGGKPVQNVSQSKQVPETTSRKRPLISDSDEDDEFESQETIDSLDDSVSTHDLNDSSSTSLTAPTLTSTPLSTQVS